MTVGESGANTLEHIHTHTNTHGAGAEHEFITILLAEIVFGTFLYINTVSHCDPLVLCMPFIHTELCSLCVCVCT